MKGPPIDFSRFGDLTHFRFVKLVKGQYVLTPKGKKVLAANPAHSKIVATLLQQQNARLHAQAKELRQILAAAKIKRDRARKSEWSLPKPPAAPKRRRKPGK
jgi:hypothetical protein